MNKERLEEVLKILARYSSNQSDVDYYQLFGFNKNETLEEINTQIKNMKLQVLFHPDQINFIPNEYHEKYLEMVEVVKNAINTFSSEKNRGAYDEKLRESVQSNNYDYNNNNGNMNNRNDYYRSNNDSFNKDTYDYSNNNSYQQSNEYEEKTEDLDEVQLQQAIITNVKKRGFEFAKSALHDIIEHNFFGSFTRDDNARSIVTNIGRQKIMELVSKVSINVNSTNLEQMIMNYFTQIMYTNPILKQQMDCLEQACINTLKKYDLNGNFGYTTQALNNYVSMGNANGFTRNNNARVNLINNVDPKNVPFIIKCALNKEDYVYDTIKNMSNDQLNTIYANNLYRKIRTNSYNDSNYGSNGNGFSR